MKHTLSHILLALAAALLLTAPAFAADTGSTPPPIPTSGDVWDGTVTAPTKLVQKNGVYYYEITTCEELAYVAQTGGDWLSYNYLLANDLILNDVVLTWDENGELTNTEELLEWTPISSFSGTFDGDGCTISGLYYKNPTGVCAGLFGSLSNKNEAVVRNVNLVNSYVYGNYWVGGIVGDKSTSEISRCTFSGLVKAMDTCAGGIFGIGDSGYGNIVSYCKNYGTIISDHDAGGVGGAGGDYENCANYGLVKYSGGNSTYSGKLFGGIVSKGDDISNCINYGNISGKSMAGGIAGETYTVSNSKNYGTVSGDTLVAGISSRVSSECTSCCNYGNITATGKYVGGITSKATIFVECCGNYGSISGGSYCGGISGYSTVTTENCYNAGAVSGTSYVGGILGLGKSCRVKNCYSIGAVAGTSSVGAILVSSDAMWGTSSVSGCYYAKEPGLNESLFGCGDSGLGEEDLAGTIAKDLEALRQKATFDGWNFEYTWSISENKNGGYPYLQWQAYSIGSISVNGVILSRTELSLSLGDSACLMASVSPTNASNTALTWSSDDDSVVSVTQSGQVTAVGVGTAAITVTTGDGGFTASCAVTVSPRGQEEYSLNALTISGQDGGSLSAIPQGEFQATVSLTKLAENGDVTVLLAAYDENGQFVQLFCAAARNMVQGQTLELSFLPDNSDGKLSGLKAFAVPSLSSPVPLGQVLEFPAN